MDPGVVASSVVRGVAFGAPHQPAEAKKGELKLLNSVATGGSIACHVSLTRGSLYV